MCLYVCGQKSHRVWFRRILPANYLGKLAAFMFMLFLPVMAFSAEINLVFTGQTYAALYPCGSCPKSVGGGLLRRATVIKQLRQELDNLIFVDAGNFTASGPRDPNSINPELNQKRSQLYYQFLAKLDYDAVAIGSNEFSFGQDFFQKSVLRSKLKFVSANLKLNGVKPYIIKQVKDLKIALLGLTTEQLEKDTELKLTEYNQALSENLKQLEAKNVDFIILVSSASDSTNLAIAKKFPAINLIVSGDGANPEPIEIVDRAIILRPAYLGKELRLVKIEVRDKNIANFKFEKRNLALDIEPDQTLAKLLPECFSANDCSKKTGQTAACQSPGQSQAACRYIESEKIKVKLITDQNCKLCSTYVPQQYLTEVLRAIDLEILDYHSLAAQEIIQKYKFNYLPIILVDPQVKNVSGFDKLAKYAQPLDQFFLLKQELAGLFTFLERKPLKKRIDYFFDYSQAQNSEVLAKLVKFAVANKIELVINFVAAPDNYNYSEEKLALAVKALYPDQYFDYLIKRVKQQDSLFLMDLLSELGIDFTKIKQWARSAQAQPALEAALALTKELGVGEGDVIVVNNTNIFKVFELDSEALKQFFKGE